ncbi:MAG: hypothetical protein A2X67_03520 [Ignavibacteria bacterium GWA2_55_11]|nr:MAG: hypothetical protein A2X67_03520 [Ignavibacteria bacterium GWA2_55_11]OGU67118.1 MAG: hypothetical protein A3C56_00095 [Ignavibacteria bacterium RIFCSPHIGHO2_02_FULL_56_12]OGU74411.1 MAG: hypothetical protein A3G43_11305 [Ignavibacteria bacterium RIFCSPLOWO2_12_FULL_56_21]
MKDVTDMNQIIAILRIEKSMDNRLELLHTGKPEGVPLNSQRLCEEFHLPSASETTKPALSEADGVG